MIEGKFKMAKPRKDDQQPYDRALKIPHEDMAAEMLPSCYRICVH